MKVDKGSDFVIINPKLVKRLELKVKLISILINYCFGMSIANKTL